MRSHLITCDRIDQETAAMTPSAPALTLVSHPLCPYVQRAAIALTEKGVGFERLTIDLAAPPDWFRAISPLGKVPLLRVARTAEPEAVLFESAVICEYIEETQGGVALHPADPLPRAQHRAWIEFASAALADLWIIETTPDAAAFEAKRRALADKFTRIAAARGDGPFFGGARFTLVDAAFGPVFRYFDVLDDVAALAELTRLPAIAAWRAALAARPSVQAAASPDYAARLRQFLMAQNSHLRGLLPA
jgi:glutathione S-transferase